MTVGKEREKGGCEEASMAVEREPGEALTIMVIWSLAVTKNSWMEMVMPGMTSSGQNLFQRFWANNRWRKKNNIGVVGQVRRGWTQGVSCKTQSNGLVYYEHCIALLYCLAFKYIFAAQKLWLLIFEQQREVWPWLFSTETQRNWYDNATLMHASSSSSMTNMTFSSKSRMMSTIVGQQNIDTSQMFSPIPKTSSQELLSSMNSMVENTS